MAPVVPSHPHDMGHPSLCPRNHPSRFDPFLYHPSTLSYLSPLAWALTSTVSNETRVLDPTMCYERPVRIRHRNALTTPGSVLGKYNEHHWILHDRNPTLSVVCRPCVRNRGGGRGLRLACRSGRGPCWQVANPRTFDEHGKVRLSCPTLPLKMWRMPLRDVCRECCARRGQGGRRLFVRA